MDFYNLMNKQQFIEKLISLKESRKMTWEQIANKISKILEGMDISEDVSIYEFQNAIRKLQVKKNQLINECVCHIYGMSDEELLKYYKEQKGNWDQHGTNESFGSDKNEAETELRKRGLLTIDLQEEKGWEVGDSFKMGDDKYIILDVQGRLIIAKNKSTGKVEEIPLSESLSPMDLVTKMDEDTEKEYVELPLSNTDKKALVDKDDLPRVLKFSWYIKKDGRTGTWYVASGKRVGGKVKTFYLHRVVMQNPSIEFDIHHKNENPLDNRKSNLQVIPHEEHVGHAPGFTYDKPMTEGGSEEEFIKGTLKPHERWYCPRCNKKAVTIVGKGSGICPRCERPMTKMDEAQSGNKLDQISYDMFGVAFEDLPDYDHQKAVQDQLKAKMFKPKRKFTKDDIYTESTNEATNTALDAQTLMKKKYKNILNGKLSPTTHFDSMEQGWLKFWLLTDGTLIPVAFAHNEAASKAGTSYEELIEDAAIPGFVLEKENALSLRIAPLYEQPNHEQMLTINKLWKQYNLNQVWTNAERIQVRSDRELSSYLRTGTKPRQREWESKQIQESMVDYARKELQLAGLFDKDSDYDGMLGEAVMELIETFASQGHSGFSAGVVTHLFNELASYKPLTELTNNPEEWMHITDEDRLSPCEIKPVWQSIRCPSCFSHDSGKTYYNLDDKENEGKDKKDFKMYTSALMKETWNKVKTVIQKNSKIINASTKEELPADIANLEDKLFGTLEEDLSTLNDPKLKKLFIQDKIEQIDDKIKDLSKLASQEKKGYVRSSIFVKIDELEREKTKLQKSLE